MAEIQKVTPPLWELAEMTVEFICPEEACGRAFKRSSNLHMHLVKHHKIGYIESKSKNQIQHFVCPVEGCSKNNAQGTNKYFTSKRLLKQHYVKIHAEKIYCCPKCSLKFSILSALNRHIKTCGAKFICGVCNWEYSTNESLIVHLSRKHPETHKKYLDINVVRKKKSTLSNIPNGLDHWNQNNIKDNSKPTLKISQPTNLKFQSQVNNSAEQRSYKVGDAAQGTISGKIEMYNHTHNSLPPTNRDIKIIKQPVSKLINTENSSNTQAMKNLNESIMKKIPIVTVLPSKTGQLVNKNVTNNLVVCKTSTGQVKKQPLNFISLSSLSNYKIVSIKKLPKKTTQSDSLPSNNRNVQIDTEFSTYNAKSIQGIKNVSEKSNDYCEDLSNYADRFTQTILKTVKKCDALETVKNTVETQTSNISAVNHAKLKIDKATNLVYGKGQLLNGRSLKRSLATQTLPKPLINNVIKITGPLQNVNYSISKQNQIREYESNLTENNADSCYNLNRLLKPDFNHMATSCNIVSNDMRLAKDYLINTMKCGNKSSRNNGKQISLLKKQYQCNNSTPISISNSKNSEKYSYTNVDEISSGNITQITYVQPAAKISETIKGPVVLGNTCDRKEPKERSIYLSDTEQNSAKIIIDDKSVVGSKSILTLQPSDNKLADVTSINSLMDLTKDGDNSLEEIFNDNTDYLDMFYEGKKVGSDMTKISNCYSNYSNIETQTALDELLYSNVPNTQQMLEKELRENDVLFSNFICQSDIQTQTSWPNNYHMGIDNLQNTLNSNGNMYMDPGSLFTCAETQTVEDDEFDFVDVFDMISDIAENNVNNPDLSYKGTQTCCCFLDSSVTFGDKDNSNMANTSDFTHADGSSNDRNRSSGVLLNSKSDVLLSFSSAETQTCSKDYNLCNATTDAEKDNCDSESSNCL